jgi:outer membrane cobalamin receptor
VAPAAGLIAFLLVCLASASPAAAQVATPPPSGGIVRGVVLDRAGGSPIADVSVRLQDGTQAVTTDASGRFELRDVPAGTRTVLVSIVGFILVKRTLHVAAGETVDVTVVLSEGTGTYSENVMVTAGPFREQERAVPAQQVLGSADIQNLRSLITNDPLRTVQVLPGVSTGDDFRSEFAVRGNAFSHIMFTFDGVPAPFLLHTVQQVQDGGSVAMVNGDILDGIALLNGSYPQRYGNRLGAEVDFLMREGSRERRQARAGVSGTDASFVAEGPLDAKKSGSWLVSVRKSYLEYLLKQVSDEDDDFGFGFSDMQAKITKDLSSRHRLELAAVAGRSRLDSRPPTFDEDEVTDGRNAAVLVNAGWRFTPSDRFGLTQRFAVASNWFSNANARALVLGDGGGSDFTWRADAVATRSKTLTFESGGQLQWQKRHEGAASFGGVNDLRFDGRTFHGSAYVQIVWSPTPRLTVTPGGRIDRWSMTSETSGSPWAQVSWKLAKGLTLRGGSGIHRQFPPVGAVIGPFGNPDLRPEQAYHVDAGVEQVFGATRWQITMFNREERGVLRNDDLEFRLSGDPRAPVDSPGIGPWHNALDGYARGVELLVQRRSTTGMSGWFSYSYGVNRYTDRRTGETFDGDFDQRHTVNAYAVFRLTNRVSLAAKWRAGSNIPATGYWRQEGARYFLSSERNTLRVPVYSRLDVRGNHTFHLGSRRLTLFIEVLNLLGRENVRVSSPFVNRRTAEVFELYQTMIPRVPSAGLLIEF